MVLQIDLDRKGLSNPTMEQPGIDVDHTWEGQFLPNSLIDIVRNLLGPPLDFLKQQASSFPLSKTSNKKSSSVWGISILVQRISS